MLSLKIKSMRQKSVGGVAYVEGTDCFAHKKRGL